MRIFRNIDGKRVDAFLPEVIGDLVMVCAPEDVQNFMMYRDKVGPPPAKADYFVVDATGPHYESESMLGHITNLGTNLKCDYVLPMNFPSEPYDADVKCVTLEAPTPVRCVV